MSIMLDAALAVTGKLTSDDFLRNAHAPPILSGRRCMSMNAMNEQTRAAVEEVRRTDCEFLTVPQVAKILKVNKNMVYDLISVKLLRAVKLGSTKVATIAVEDFIREMDAGLIEYDHVTKKATRHRSKAKSAASQNK